VVTLPYPAMLYFFQHQLEWKVVLTGYLGLLLLLLCFISIGIWASSITESQIISFVITFGALLLFWIIAWLSYAAPPTVGKVLESVSILEHFDSFAKGVLDTHDILFYLSFSFFFLYLAYAQLLARKWRG